MSKMAMMMMMMMIIIIINSLFSICSAYSLRLWFCTGQINNAGCSFPLSDRGKIPNWKIDNPATNKCGLHTNGGVKIRLLHCST